MPHQPSPASTPTPSVSSSAACCLAVAAVAAFGLAVLIYVDLFTPLEPSRPAGALLAFVGAVGGYGYISRSAEDRAVRREAAAVDLILDRIERVEKRMDAHAANLTEQGQETQASVFVGAAAGGRHLNAVPRG